jgi:hypothetical protein
MGRKLKVVDITKEEPVNDSQVEDTQTVVEDTPVVDDTPVVENTVVDETPVVETPASKPRAKPRSKKPLPEAPIEPAQEVKQEVEEIKEPSVEKIKIKKVVEQVQCPKCDKLMSQKSLRYSHEENCKGKVVKTEEQPVKRRIKKEATPEPQATTNKKEIYQEIVKKNSNIDSSEVEIPEAIKLEVLKSIQRQQIRLKMKEDNLNRLKMQSA